MIEHQGITRISAIILAAGSSTRMGLTNKLLLPISGTPMIECVIRAAVEQDFEKVIVVTGYDASGVQKVLAPFPVQIVYNSLYDTGMGSSLVAGIEADLESDVCSDAYLIWPGDMPFIRRKTIQLICSMFDPESIIVPTFDSHRGHPVLFGARFREALLNIPSDKGARTILKNNSDSVIECPVEDAAILRDVDTPEDLY